MSHQATSWAYDQDITPSGAKFVLVTLANYANGEGYCYPGQEKLARDTGMSARAVRVHLVNLEDAGLIYRERRVDKLGRRKSDGYWLVGFCPLPADIAGSLAEESATCQPEDSSGNQPEDIAEPTGRFRQDNRKNLPVHNIRNINRQSEPSEEPSDKAAQPPNAHYGLYEICCHLNGGSPEDNPDPSKQLKVFVRLLSKYSFADIEGCMRWMASDDFLKNKRFDAFDVERHMDKYLMAGRPRDRTSPARNGKKPDPATEWLEWAEDSDEQDHVWQGNGTVIDVTPAEKPR